MIHIKLELTVTNVADYSFQQGSELWTLYYGGNIGYVIGEDFRGHSYAMKACKLLVPVIKAHGMTKILITNNYTNIASRRTCEKLGAKLLRLARLPEWHDLYKVGRRFSNIFEWDLSEGVNRNEFENS